MHKRLIGGDAAAGVPKERMEPSDMFVLDAAGEITETPSGRPAPYKAPKLSECAPLFMSVSSSRISRYCHLARCWPIASGTG